MQARKFLAKFITIAILLFLPIDVWATSTDFIQDKNNALQARIIASPYAQNNENKLIAGFHVKIKSGWQIYGKDDSGFGQPPTFDFTNSSNINTNQFDTIFPEPIIKTEEIGDEIIKYAIYQDEIIIPLDLQIIDPNQNTNLEVTVYYGLCKDICIPVTQKFSLKIPALKEDADSLINIQQFLPKEFTITKLTKAKKDAKKSNLSLAKALIIALIGGIILNIMPCVLPVLSIKLLNVIEHSNAKISRIRFAFFSTFLGIIFSFLVFAIVTSALKILGNEVGWGLQFQNSYFLILLLAILMIFIANLIGLFEFSTNSKLSSALNNKITKEEDKKNIFAPNFISGILAVLLATPCSAPFVGVAISFALASQISDIFLIFTTMGLGLALPYVLLMIYPKAVYLLPKPGQWMLTIKNLMAGFLAATAIWLLYILCDNIGFVPAMVAGFFAITILVFFKKINFLKTKLSKYFGLIILISLMVIAPNSLSSFSKEREAKFQKNWIEFNQAKLQKLIDQDKIVIIDITASWCITCKVNKALVLDSKEITKYLNQENIVGMRGDISTPNQAIMDFMRGYNRYAIPFNLVFGPNAKEGILVSELLSKDALIKVIEKVSK